MQLTVLANVPTAELLSLVKNQDPRTSSPLLIEVTNRLATFAHTDREPLTEDECTMLDTLTLWGVDNPEVLRALLQVALRLHDTVKGMNDAVARREGKPTTKAP